MTGADLARRVREAAEAAGKPVTASVIHAEATRLQRDLIVRDLLGLIEGRPG